MSAPYSKGQAPYYDQYNASKGYSQLLFRPGLGLQNRELNELQSMLQYRMKGIGDTILTDGDIVEGCQLIIPDTATAERACTLTGGRIYLDGAVRVIPETHFNLHGIGVETVGVKLKTEVITEVDDPDLDDPAAGFANYRQSGAHRLKETIEVVINDETASNIFTVQDGQLVTNAPNESETVLDRFNSTLARRTFDESGNYKVWGLEMSQKPAMVPDPDHLFISMSAGKAYVKGVEVIKQAATTLTLDRATDVRAVRSEPKAYNLGTQLYPLNNTPVREITGLTATISMTMQLTRGSIANGADPIPEMYRPAVDIQNIIQAGISKNYVKGRDYTLQSDTINWGLAGDEPAAGESYTVTFTYNRSMVEGEDYELYFDGNHYYIKLLKNYTEATPDASGNMVNGIVNGSTMLVDYNFMLHYAAIVTLDSEGQFRIIKGQSDIAETVALPDVNDTDVLVMGSILVSPRNDNLLINNERNTRLSMAELQDMVLRLYNLEYNTAISDLDNEAMAGEEATMLKGIYTDGFIGFSKCDLNYDNQGIKFTAGLDLDNGELTLGAPGAIHELAVKTRTDLNPPSSAKAYDRIMLGASTLKAVANQPYATGVTLINPYLVFPDRPVMSINPSVDNWIDTEHITLHHNVDGGTRVTQNVIHRTIHSSGRNSSRVVQSQTSSTSSTSTSSSRVIESAILYMRSRTVTVSGSKFGSHRGQLVLKFNDNEVPYTATGNYKGVDGKLKSDSQGRVVCTFTVPANTLCGTVSVELYPEDEPDFRARCFYTANGKKRTTQTTITTTTTTTVFQTILDTYDADPLAQTFEFDRDQMITALGLYFCVADPNQDIVIQVRDVVNGYPGGDCYAEKVIPAGSYRGSELGNGETKVEFDNPIYCRANTQYCFVVMTESSIASLYHADIGGYDLLTKAQVLKNPYIPGMMFSSSNAKAWTAHQSQNLKFNIYGNAFADRSYAYFDAISQVRYDRICLLADTEIPVDCELTWEYSRDDGVTWLPLSINQDIEVTTPITSMVIRACFKSNGSVSPALALDSLGLIGYLNDVSSDYVMRNIITDEGYTHIKQVVDIYAPTGTMVNVYYSTDNVTWLSATQTDSKLKDAQGFIQYTFEATVNEATNYRARIALTTNNPCIRPRVRNFMNILT